ncbi:MAG: peptidylprolyl isomerase [Endozoicomonadaceae bacterium]|nr:peptidylprolyl isomerase [Endozoicomonadaceae bacterium]
MLISKGCRIKLHFSMVLRDENKTISSTFRGKPAELTVGDGSLFEYFESCLLNLSTGAEQTFVIPPDKAFGQYNSQNIHVIPRSKFTHKLEKGLIIMFEGQNTQTLPGIITDFNSSQVTVDFNHPLAGKTLLFRVKILDVAAPNYQIITTDKMSV